jgi:hypothetical protein
MTGLKVSCYRKSCKPERVVWQPNHIGILHSTRPNIHLHLHQMAIDAIHGRADRFEKHALRGGSGATTDHISIINGTLQALRIIPQYKSTEQSPRALLTTRPHV